LPNPLPFPNERSRSLNLNDGKAHKVAKVYLLLFMVNRPRQSQESLIIFEHSRSVSVDGKPTPNIMHPQD
jgi:hypothetical protein